MLVFIGGAARTGKSMLVRRLLVEMQLPYLSIDVLKMGLARGVPEFGIDPDAGGPLVAEKLWPLVREMSASLLVDDIDYCIEGELLPSHVAALQQQHPVQIKACFLGYATITPAQKLHDIRTHAGHPNDWASTYTDTALLKIIIREIAFSQYVMDACAKYAMRYFDTSHDFVQTLEQVAAYVKGRGAA